MELHNLCDQVCQLSEEVATYIRGQRKVFQREHIETKASHDYVTRVDKTAEEMFVRGLTDLLPEAGFIAEEGTSDKKGERYDWVIDPLDGTTNFIHNIPSYCTSVALIEDRKPVLGVVAEVPHQEIFHAFKGGGAFCNGTPLSISPADQINDALIVSGFPRFEFKGSDRYMEVFRQSQILSRGVRRLGSAAADLVYVASGRFEVFYEYALQPWDVAAGTLIVEEAGGKVTDFGNGGDPVFGQQILATNGKVHQEFLDLIRENGVRDL